MATRRHVTLVGLGFGDVDDAVKEVGFTVLAAEVLGTLGGYDGGIIQTLRVRREVKAYSTQDVIAVGKMGLAVDAAVDARGVQVDVVG